jgi:hypothetical protein
MNIFSPHPIFSDILAKCIAFTIGVIANYPKGVRAKAQAGQLWTSVACLGLAVTVTVTRAAQRIRGSVWRQTFSDM